MQDPSGELTITGVVQREAWLQRAMPPAEELGEDLWSLPVPIPDNPLRYVSVYAFGTGDGLVLIDAGWGAEESWRALRDGLESIGAGVAGPGGREPDPPARVYGEGGMTGPAVGGPGQPPAARPAGSSTGASARSTLLRSGSRAAAPRVITTHAMM